ncbi:tyrosine-type recombinase/integrase [Limibacter armeniacum]|uniref:tyrosine-type recombinase/integrase n=1 Tax=Limibacter armeniacum TaxID=466084 RepID=UPI002FE5257B
MAEVKVTERKQRDGRIVLYLYYRHNSKRFRKSTGIKLFEKPRGEKERLHNRKAWLTAEKLALELQVSLKEGTGSQTASRITLHHAVDHFTATKTKENTRIMYQQMNKRVKGFFSSHLKLSELTKSHCRDFYDYLCQDSGKVSTANLRFINFKAVLNYFVKKEILLKNPAQYIEKRKSDSSQRVYLNESELELLKRTGCNDKELKRYFLFACYTGLRYSDLKALTYDQIRDNTVYISKQVKTSDSVTIPLSAFAKSLLDRKGRGYVFRIPSNSLVTYRLADWTRRAGIDKRVTIHTARHTFATLLLTKGVDIYTVKDLLGHKSLNSTMVYAKIINLKRQKAIELLDSQ